MYIVTVEPAFVESDCRASVIGRDVAYGLPGAGILGFPR